jgi:serine/threonine protein kinase
MDPHTERCDAHRLGQYLHDELAADGQRALEAHLEVCPACQRQLDELAGGAVWWHDVRHCLGAVEDSWEVPTQHPFAPAESWQSDLTFLEPSTSPGSLGRLGSYEVLEVIGRGGMGIVLRAFDPALHRPVAIKVLAAELALHGAARKRFAREAQAAAAVSHDHVVPVHAVNPDAVPPYLVMAYIPGESLQQRIDRSGPLELKEILRIGHQTAAGLAAAHAQGLVHRDIKPANIMLENGIERVRITDFGLARAVDDASVTRSGSVAGTPQYMAPEQAEGKVLDQRADLFALGSTLYAMCTGRAPFRASSGLAVLRQVADTEPTPIRSLNPDIPAWLEGIITKLHRKQPQERFQHAAAVAALLEECLAHVQQPDRQPLPRLAWDLSTGSDGPRRPQLRRRTLPAILALLLLAGVLVCAPWLRNPAGRTSGTHALEPSNDFMSEQEYDTSLTSVRQRLENLQQGLAPAALQGDEGGFEGALAVLRQRAEQLARNLAPGDAPEPDAVERELGIIRQRLQALEQQAGRLPE